MIPPEHYRPGMGIVAAVVLLLAAGTLVNALIVRRLFAAWEGFLDRIPVVKTIYGAIRSCRRGSGRGCRMRRSIRRLRAP